MAKITTTETLRNKKALLDVLENVFRTLDEREESTKTDYVVVGEKQATDWRTGELKWEDEAHTIPKMTNEYGLVPLDPDKMSDDAKATLWAIETIRQALEKLI